ncbi:MAG: hypothetical protein MJZ63_03975 [Muribaculaceae bacterium]|nr:hypothetical protein [Muribaculaceae bacterium]
MKKILSMLMLLVPTLLMAQGHVVAANNELSIHDGPNGRLLIQLPKSADCEAFTFLVDASKNGWLRINKSTFSPANVIIKNGEEVENTEFQTLDDIPGECWVRCDDVWTDHYCPGAVSTGDKCYAGPSKKSKYLGKISPKAILEVKGDWVKVKGYPEDKRRRSGMEYDYNRQTTGWMYKPNLSIDLCSA